MNPEKSHVFTRVQELAEWLLEQQCELLVEEGVEYPHPDAVDYVSREDMAREAQVVIVFGGDGTLLHASHAMARFGTPLLGVNSGGLGFLTETTLDEMIESVARILNSDYQVKKRMMLSGTWIDASDSTIHCLNDLVLSRSRLGRVIEISAYVNGVFVTRYVCDGIIVSTPTGSTAYNLSANGPILHPQLEAIILNPICPHTLTNRPLILPPESQIELQIQSRDECVLTADGQDKICHLGQGDRVKIVKSNREVTLIQPEERDFYSILRTKLHWGGKTS